MINRDQQQGPGEGPLDAPEPASADPIGGDAYPGGSGMNPPTGDMENPIPESGMPGEPEEVGPEPDQRP